MADMPTNTEAKRLQRIANYRAANAARHREGAARQVVRAQAALPKLEAAPVDEGRNRTQTVLNQYRAAVRLRVCHPRDTVDQLAYRVGMSKGRYASILRRALKYAETIR